MKNNIGVKDFYSEVIALVKLYLASPATNAVSQRSASAMRRLKNWLRSTMSQERLNHCMLLSIHKEKTDEINLKCIYQYTFGMFCDEDGLNCRSFFKKITC